MRRTLVVLVASLLAVPAGHAKTLVVRSGWEEARAMLTGGEYRRKIRVELRSSERVKGEFIEATGAGLRLAGKGYETRFAREDIRAIRLVPRKAKRFRYWLLGLLGGIPAGFGAGYFAAIAIGCGGDIDRCTSASTVIFLSALIAVPYGFYELGARADRGAVLIVLDESAAKNPPVPPQAEQLSPAKEEQP